MPPCSVSPSSSLTSSPAETDEVANKLPQRSNVTCFLAFVLIVVPLLAAAISSVYTGAFTLRHHQNMNIIQRISSPARITAKGQDEFRRVSINMNGDSSSNSWRRRERSYFVGRNERGLRSSDPKFLILHEANEGISKWIYIIYDLFALAARYQRVVVEPCVLKAKISSCLDDAAVPLSEVLDLESLANFYKVKFISFLTYLADYSVPAMSSSIMCASKRTYKASMNHLRLEEKTLHYTQAYNLQDFVVVESNHENCLQKYAEKTTVIFFSPWLHNLLYSSSPQRNKEVPSLLELIPESHFEHVEHMLDDSEIDKDEYVAVGWTTEGISREHILSCAESLVQYSKDFAVANGLRQDSFALVADMSFPANRTMEHVKAKNAEINMLVPVMLKGIFFKPEMSRTTYNSFSNIDPIFLTIWDIIISLRAKYFVSCIDKSKEKPCRYCSKTDSHFMRLLMDLRRSDGLKSYISWKALDLLKEGKDDEEMLQYLYNDTFSLQNLDADRFFDFDQLKDSYSSNQKFIPPQ